MNTKAIIYNKVKKVGTTLCLLLLATCFFTSCNDWLDVSPKSQIKEEDHFSREGGYKDQLKGIYTALTTQSMYGLNMGIGFAEVLSHTYNIDPNGNWRYANDFNYTESLSESTISTIWSSTYSAITNCNILIRNIEKADPNIFTDYNYHVYHGEALGLRAFLHFDLMRLFACAPSMNSTAPGVPYVTEYSTEVVGQKSVNETMQLIVNDLMKAREELAYDTLTATGEYPNKDFDFKRNNFNYFACTLTLAKAYLWMGDTQNALRYAKELVDWTESDIWDHCFTWVHYTNMQQTARNQLDTSFSTEHIFQLRINDWEDIGNYYFMSEGGANALTPAEATVEDIYEISMGLGGDWRYTKGFEQDGEKRYSAKFWYVAGSSYNNIYPLLRMSEPFYIAAECYKNTNPKEAIRLLQVVRENRGLSADNFPLSENLTAEQIHNEFYKEYRKEFIGEYGELFFYYKRLNAAEIKGSALRPGKGVYVLPIPSNDQEFGGYSN